MNLNNIFTSIAPLLTFVWTISWTILQDKRNKYKDFINQKDQEILSKLLLPYYETIELNLYKTITQENKNELMNNLRNLIKYIRRNNLFFYLGSPLSSTLIEIEKTLQNDQNNLNHLNKLYKKFSNKYLALSWSVRKNLKIEKEQYYYVSNTKIEAPLAREEYYLNPRIVLKYFFIYSLFLFFIFFILYLKLKSKSIIISTYCILLSIFMPLYYIIIFIPNLKKLFTIIKVKIQKLKNKE